MNSLKTYPAFRSNMVIRPIGLAAIGGITFDMPAIKNEIGKIYGKLTVLRYSHLTRADGAFWIVKCECGNIIPIRGTTLRCGGASSCGCNNKRRLRHGCCYLKTSVEYSAWQGMKCRCYNSMTPNYNNYGGRGITVCKRWVNSFENFLADMGEKPFPKYSLDRINNNGNYTPKNCRWTDRSSQNLNRRNTVYVKYYGKKRTLKDLSEKFNITWANLYRRLFILNWSVSKAIHTPLREQFSNQK